MDFSSLNFPGGKSPDFGSNAAAPISLDLQKGFTLDLSKPNGASLSEVRVSLIWDPVIQGTDVDIDLSAFLLHNGKITSAADVVYFNTPKMVQLLPMFFIPMIQEQALKRAVMMKMNGFRSILTEFQPMSPASYL